jgi:hypothetical protein
MVGNHLPTFAQTNFSIAKCTVASVPVTISHFGICLEVQFINGPDAKKILNKLEVWMNYTFSKGQSVGVEDLITAARRSEIQTLKPVELAIMYNIRSLMLVESYDSNWYPGYERPIKLCYRLQCCQFEENEFKRLFGKVDATFERIWLGDKSDVAIMNITESEHSHFRGRKRLRIL